MANQLTNAAIQRSVKLSNRMTEVLLDVVILSCRALVSHPAEQTMLSFLEERNADVVARNERGFDISELPWDPTSEHRQIEFLRAAVADAMTQDRWDRLDYEPQTLNVLVAVGQWKTLLPQQKKC